MFLKLSLVFHLPTFGKAWPLCLVCIATAPEVQSTIILYPSVYLLRPCLLVFSQQQFEVGICCPVNLRLLGLLVFLNQNSEGFCLILIEHSWFNVMIHCYFVATFLRNLVLSSFFLIRLFIYNCYSLYSGPQWKQVVNMTYWAIHREVSFLQLYCDIVPVTLSLK